MLADATTVAGAFAPATHTRPFLEAIVAHQEHVAPWLEVPRGARTAGASASTSRARSRPPELRRGWIVEAAIEAHFKALLAAGEPLPPARHRGHLRRRLAAPDRRRRRRDRLGRRHAGARQRRRADRAARHLAELAPTVRPASVQREFAFALAPALEWTLTGRLDLEAADGDVIDASRSRSATSPRPTPTATRNRACTCSNAPWPAAPPRASSYHSVNPTAKHAKTKIVPTAAHARRAAGLRCAHPRDRTRDRRPAPAVRARARGRWPIRPTGAARRGSAPPGRTAQAERDRRCQRPPERQRGAVACRRCAARGMNARSSEHHQRPVIRAGASGRR